MTTEVKDLREAKIQMATKVTLYQVGWGMRLLAAPHTRHTVPPRPRPGFCTAGRRRTPSHPAAPSSILVVLSLF
jgi:hypothetical protein